MGRPPKNPDRPGRPTETPEQGHLRERAFRYYIEAGRRIKPVEMRLKKEGYVITDKALYKWRKEYDWDARADNLDRNLEELRGEISDEAMLRSLLARKRELEKNMALMSPGAANHTQAMYAYNGTVKQIIAIREKTAAYRVNIYAEFMEDLLEYFEGAAPTYRKTFFKHMSKIINFAKRKYGGVR